MLPRFLTRHTLSVPALNLQLSRILRLPIQVLADLEELVLNGVVNLEVPFFLVYPHLELHQLILPVHLPAQVLHFLLILP